MLIQNSLCLSVCEGAFVWSVGVLDVGVLDVGCCSAWGRGCGIIFPPGLARVVDL